MGAVSVQAFKTVIYREAYAVECLSVSCTCGCEWQQHFVVAACKGLFAFSSLVYRSYRQTMDVAEHAQQFCA